MREKENQERESREWWVSAVKEDYLNKMRIEGPDKDAIWKRNVNSSYTHKFQSLRSKKFFFAFLK